MTEYRCAHMYAEGMEGGKFTTAYFTILILFMTNVNAPDYCFVCFCAPAIGLQPVENPTSDFLDVHD